MRDLFIEIIDLNNQRFIKKIRSISDKKYNQIIKSDSDEISKEMIKDKKVISFYKDQKIDLLKNMIFDISYNDDLYLIDDLSTRYMIDL